jgi:hypothetical protein
MTTLKYKKLKIRKRHFCHACLRKFDPDTEMFYFFCVDGGDFGSGYVCLSCDEIFKLKKISEWERGEVSNFLDRDQTPEDYLTKIKIKNRELINLFSKYET